MFNEFFIEQAKQIFCNLQNENALCIKENSNCLTYYNSDLNFSIYYERQFEVYICIHIKNKNLRLLDVVRYLKLPEGQVDAIGKNQVHSEEGIVKILCSMESIMRELISSGKFQEILLDCLKANQLFEKKAIAMEQLERSWKKGEYQEYIRIFSANENDLQNSSNYSMLRKRFDYARKHKRTAL